MMVGVAMGADWKLGLICYEEENSRAQSKNDEMNIIDVTHWPNPQFLSHLPSLPSLLFSPPPTCCTTTTTLYHHTK